MKHLKSINEYWYSEEDERYYSDDEQPKKEEEIPIEQQIYDEVEMRLSPTDTTLPFSEIVDIANMYDVDEEDVARIMINYTTDRYQKAEEDLKYDIREVIRDEFDGEAPEFAEFYKKFKELNYEDDMIADFDKDEINRIYDELTKDPNQLSLEL